MQKILIIDDDPQMYRLYKTIFAMENFEVEVAEDGQAGLDKVKTFQPNVILLDIMMKTMNGLDVLTALKADTAVSHIPVVVLSNVSDTVVINQAKAKGAVQFVVKSNTEPGDMVALVRSVLAKAHAADAGPAPSA